jgi:hypothetical protein
VLVKLALVDCNIQDTGTIALNLIKPASVFAAPEFKKVEIQKREKI